MTSDDMHMRRQRTISKLVYWDVIQSPLAGFAVAVDECGAVVAAGFENGRFRLSAWLEKKGYVAQQDRQACFDAASQVAQYFAGERKGFELRLAPEGTQYQQRVWAELSRIPFGETRTYGQIAKTLNEPNPRAIGSANAANPIALIVPCHRVIGADGSLTGYAGGLEIKRWLLDFERRDTLF